MVEKLTGSKVVFISYRNPAERATLLQQAGADFSRNRERGASHGQQQRAAMSEALHPTPKKLGS